MFSRMTDAEIDMFVRDYDKNEAQKLIDEAKAYDLYGREVLEKFSLERICQEFNGIGPDRMRPIYRKILTWLGRRYLSCVLIHDMDYVIGGNERDFHDSNERLRMNLNKMLNIFFSKWNPWYWVEWVSINYIIFAECEYFGWEGFHKNIPPEEEIDEESQPSGE